MKESNESNKGILFKTLFCWTTDIKESVKSTCGAFRKEYLAIASSLAYQDIPSGNVRSTF